LGYSAIDNTRYMRPVLCGVLTISLGLYIFDLL
jgi:hypothetical protein